MRTRAVRSAGESASSPSKASVAHGRELALGRTPPRARPETPESPETDAPQASTPSRENTPFRLVPAVRPQPTVVEKIGEALGEDFSTVRIEPRSRDAVALGALAFARREQVGFAPGQYRPETSVGRRLIAHELAHVAQQRRSPVPATGTIGGLEVNEDPRLEEEAERLGARAAAGAAGAPGPVLPPGPFVTNGMTSSPAQLGKAKKDQREIEAARRRREREREREEAAREREINRLAAKSTDALIRQWTGIMIRTEQTFAKIREIDQISQAHPRPRRLQGRDRDISQRIEQLDRLAQRLILKFNLQDVRGGQALQTDKQTMARIIVEGRERELELGVISSDAEARLGPRDDFAGDLNTYVYHTGAQNDPIPIVWYKNPATDYADIVIPPANAGGVTPGNYGYPQGPRIADGFPFNLTVAAANQPVLNNLAAFELQKQPIGSRPDKTPNQVRLNAELKNAGYDLRDRNPKMDGDHVRDLGFGGDDAFDNYWPLNERINRRAFLGYNSNYLVNFINHTKDAGQVNANGNPNGRETTQPIGGMAGRYFVIKSFLANNDGSIPDESGEETAGTA